MPWKSMTSVPGRIGRYRSAISAVSVRRGSATMIFSAGLARLRVLDAAEQDRMRPGRVAADDEEALGVLQVVVAGGRRIGAQRLLVAGHRAAHAQARVGVDVVGADQALGELVEDVVVLGQQLAGDVEADRVGAVLADRPARSVSAARSSARVPADRAAARRRGRARRIGCSSRVCRVIGGAGRQVQRRALGAQAAEVGRVLRVAAHAGDLRALGLDDHAAADAAVGAGGAWFRVMRSVPAGRRRCASVPATRRVRGRSRASPARPRPAAPRRPSTLHREARRAAFVGRLRAAVVQADGPVVQRAGHAGAEHDALASAGRPCAGSGRAARTPGPRRCGTPRRRRPRPRARGARRAPGCRRRGRSTFHSLMRLLHAAARVDDARPA